MYHLTVSLVEVHKAIRERIAPEVHISLKENKPVFFVSLVYHIR